MDLYERLNAVVWDAGAAVLRVVGRRFTRRTSRRTFVVAIVVALLLMPVAEALAFFSATGSGTIAGAAVASAPTVSITLGGGTAFTYAGGSTTNLVPGGTVTFPVRVSCTANCPAQVSTIRLSSVTSDKAGCDSTTLPGSWTAPNLNVNQSITTTTDVGSMTVTFVNTASDQTACAGATLTFHLSTP
ncbi:MAG TPA: hypothetical protein VGU71_04190 [Candidatus Dormibacteraeota bacterium]|nr:hypothetical protein [Candidatus Dormibacteraeota bacterium]